MVKENKRIIYPIYEKFKDISLYSYIDKCYKNKQYIACISLINLEIESLLKTLIKRKRNKSFVDMRITYRTNERLIENTTKQINNLTLGDCFYICFWCGLINFNLYGKIKKHIRRRNKFSHSLWSIIKMDLKSIKLYYKDGKYIISELNKIIYDNVRKDLKE